MFDIGFWELMVIATMGLVILGPERLPVAIRSIRAWIGGARKFTEVVKAELTEELRINELHANLKKAEQAEMKNLSPEVSESLKSLEEARDMVTQPFKSLDTQALDSMISDSLASMPKDQADEQSTSERESILPENANTNESATHTSEANVGKPRCDDLDKKKT